ncbi:putative DNA protection during starvation protein 2 [Bacteriovorax sp. BSW11_IV]|uniref:Dps family protein n=1 Tax=Bacteriovorax sp. BSW11_IV TaxID=1353529 RepID=UPI00038A29E9|nr:DNA starvation/stationary phase protection protein [Bacteriovorax sp. BSW11_IV]EQC46462.1 putative DNA protection during starvation protein 2 [Bacteriovorax sp. BSW11_IV]
MKNITEKMNLILADLHILGTKAQNYHWNIKGERFFEIHAKTEGYYDHLQEVYDALAERILQLGGRPLVTLKQILEVGRISEDASTDFNAKYVVENILKDFDFLRTEFKALSQMSEGDTTTVAFADEQVAFLDKETWMLRSFLGQGL